MKGISKDTQKYMHWNFLNSFYYEQEYKLIISTNLIIHASTL